jgi:hypothetical protein
MEPPHGRPQVSAILYAGLPVLLICEPLMEPLRRMNQRHGWSDTLCAAIIVAYLYLLACMLFQLGDRALRRCERRLS